MYAIPTGSVLECLWRGLLDDQLVMNTFHYVSTVDYADGALRLQQALTSFNGQVWSRIQPGISTDVEDVVLSAQWITPQRYRAAVQDAAPKTGGVASEAEPSGCAVVVRRYGELSSRTNQGRIFVPGIAKDDTLASQVTDAWYAANEADYTLAVTSPLVDADAAFFIPIVYNPRAPDTTRFVQTGGVDNILRYQRRREIGKGK